MADAILADVNSSGIYQILNLSNGKRYIGSAKCFRKRWACHLSGFRTGKHPNRKLLRSWLKHGKESFVFEILETCTDEKLIVREQHWIDASRPEYNLSPTAGNCLGVKMTDQAKRKISERNLGNMYCVGRKLSEATKRAIGVANSKRRGFKRSPEAVAKSAAKHRGMKRSDETRRKIADSRIGKKLKQPRSAEYRAKMSAAHKGRVISDGHMAALQAGRALQVFTAERRSALSERIRQQYESGKRSREKSEEHKNRIGMRFAKLSDEQVREIRTRRLDGDTCRAIAAKFSCPESTVAQICRGKRYRWVA